MFLIFLGALAAAGGIIWAVLWAVDKVTGRPGPPAVPAPLPPVWEELRPIWEEPPPACPHTGRPAYDHPAYDRCPCGRRHVVNTATRRRVEPGVESG
jgi:hypothetical protein